MRRLSVLLASAVMALTLIAFAVVTGASAAPKQQTPQQQPNQSYGALDYSQAQDKFYWATGTSKEAANQAAYDACTKAGATDCLTRVWVYNGFVALAQSDQNFDVGWGATKDEASNAAVMRCESGGATCTVTGWANTDIDPNKQATGGYELPGP